MSGTGNPTFLVAASGDQGIDGLIDNRAWSGGSITYSFSVSSAAYNYAGTGLTDLPANFNTISAAQEAAAHFALNADIGPSADAGFSVEGFTNLTITSNGNTNAGNSQIRYGETSSAIVNTARVADFPGGTETGPVDDNGDVWFGTAHNYRSPQAGNYEWHTMLHETGHALGLKHGQATYNFGALPSNLDAMEFTVMTYRSYVNGPTTGYTNETWGYAQTYMMQDIAALQYMYGADYTTNSGNTVYSWNPGSGDTLVNGAVAINPGGNRIFATIWDGGGIDTYDLSAYTTHLQIDLSAGGHSLFSTVQQAYLGNSNYASGNIYNALLFQGNTASLIENAIGGSGDDDITGNEIDNVLSGGAGNDTLKGAGGNDTLNGDDGNDTLKGGGGSDALNGGAGTDTADYAFAGAVDVNLATGVGGGDAAGDTYNSIENVNGSGNNDTITGDGSDNVLNGNAGNDTLIGGGGSDTLNGGDGSDTLNGGSGFDTISGGAGNDTIQHTGGDFGGNVDGGADIDTLDLSGWTNSSIAFNVNLSTNNYQFLPNNFGVDGTYTLVNVENVTGSNFNDSITGDGNFNVLNGGGGNDTVTDNDSGDDNLNGGADIDTLISDLTYVDDALFDFNTGLATFSGGTFLHFTNFENITLGGGADVNGNSSDNVITITDNGFTHNNTVDSGFGFDTVSTGIGDDTIIDSDGSDDNFDGGAGIDLLSSELSYVDDALFNFNSNLGTFSGGTFVHFTNFENISVSGGADVIGNNNANIITATDAAGSGVNNINGGGGNDTISTAGGNDILNGGTGNDSMTGGTGNDQYFVDSTLDTVFEGIGGGSDRIFSSVSYALAAGQEVEILGSTNTAGVVAINFTGNEFNNALLGNNGVNTLNGGIGIDQMTGYLGNDAYFVDNAADVVIEAVGGGVDRVYSSVNYILAAAQEIETLVTTNQAGVGAINLTGNVIDNTIGGNNGNNALNGGGGADTMFGYGGNDQYFVDNALDRAFEAVGGGTDRVLSSVSFTLAAGQEIEILSTTNTAGIGAINLTGNAFNNTVVGNNGNNTLNGGLGNDILTGNGGSDIFVFNTALNAATNHDTITDFNVAADTINLENAVFTLLGAGALGAALFGVFGAQDASDVILYDQANGDLYYDSNGLAAGGQTRFADVTNGLALTNLDFFVI
jgi:serralysin